MFDDTKKITKRLFISNFMTMLQQELYRQLPEETTEKAFYIEACSVAIAKLKKIHDAIGKNKEAV